MLLDMIYLNYSGSFGTLVALNRNHFKNFSKKRFIKIQLSIYDKDPKIISDLFKRF